MTTKYRYGKWNFDTVGFGSALTAAIKVAGLQRQEVAEAVGVSSATVSEICKGQFDKQSGLPSISIVTDLCNLFDLDIRDFWYVQW